MRIENLQISNFKSIESLSVDLRKLNLLVGANASGKSNIVQALLFLRDIIAHGLENTISSHGGVKYVRNVRIANERPLAFRIAIDAEEDSERVPGFFFSDNEHAEKLKRSLPLFRRFEYEFSLNFQKRGTGFGIGRDRMTIVYLHEKLESKGGESSGLSSSSVELSRHRGKLRAFSNPGARPLEVVRNFPIPKKGLLIEAPVAGFFVDNVLKWIQEIGFYDIDPKLTKRSAIPIAGRSDLEMDGSNLAVVLNKLFGDRESKRKFLNFCQYTLPFIHNIGIDKVADRSVYIELSENYAKEKRLPAFLISDGTINVVALIVALYFQEKKHFAIFEEPERNIHPYLLSKVMGMFKESSKTKQILATTHNPELLRHAELEDVLLVSRSDEGFTQLARPADSQQVRIFLENEMGIDDLFLNNLLGV